MSTVIDKPDELDASLLPRLHDGVSIRMTGPNAYTVRDELRRTYFQTGEQEAFLLQQLKAASTWQQLAENYSRQFSGELSKEDFAEFEKVLRARRLLKAADLDAGEAASAAAADLLDEANDESNSRRGSILYYRLPLLDPDRFLSFFTKTFPFFWTRGFLVGSIAVMLFSFLVLVNSRHELVATFQSVWQFETVAVTVLAVLLATAIHELGHGATCKRFGGSVHESGLLFMFFMPCMYVNVSDAWFIPERTKRLAITFAGGYCDLCLWALSVLVWRVTQFGTLPNHVAFILMTTCATRSLMNFNPLLRLDGYYLLTDLLDFPNLYSKARNYWMGSLNSWLWGAAKPEAPTKRKWFVLLYGFITWLFAIAFLNVIGLNLIEMAGSEFGLVGLSLSIAMFLYGVRRVFRGFFGSEFVVMVRKRFLRTSFWLAGVGLLVGMSFVFPVKHYAVGDFEVRPASHTEISSPMHSFISNVLVQDGQYVEKGSVLLELHAPELASQISGKHFELEQSRATLAKLEAGARPEEIESLAEKVRLLTDWCELGESELKASQEALDFQLQSLLERAKQVRVQIELAEIVLRKSEELQHKGAVAGAQVMHERAQLAILRSQSSEIQSLHESKAKEGVRIAVAELARRRQQLSEAEALLRLLKLGARDEEIAAERARCERVSGEFEFLKKQKQLLVVESPVSGLVLAPRLREKVGQFAPQGSVLCQSEDPGIPHVEIFVSEDDAALIQPGQAVQLKARSLPFETFTGVVARIAPGAAKPQEAVASQQAVIRQSVVVHCTVEGADNKLKSGMTGFGRVYRGYNKVGSILLAKCYRYIRTEFWW